MKQHLEWHCITEDVGEGRRAELASGVTSPLLSLRAAAQTKLATSKEQPSQVVPKMRVAVSDSTRQRSTNSFVAKVVVGDKEPHSIGEHLGLRDWIVTLLPKTGATHSYMLPPHGSVGHRLVAHEQDMYQRLASKLATVPAEGQILRTDGWSHKGVEYLGMMLSFLRDPGSDCEQKTLVREVYLIGLVDLSEFSGPDLGTMKSAAVATRAVEQQWARCGLGNILPMWHLSDSANTALKLGKN